MAGSTGTRLQHAVFVFVPGGTRAEPQRHLGVAYIQAALTFHPGVTSSQVVSEVGASVGWYRDVIVQQCPTFVGFTVFEIGRAHV